MTLAPDRTPSRRLQGLVAALWIAALYFLCRPYRGVRHDAQLYFGQTELHLYPDWMRGDLFFLNNSQDNYSLFSTIFAPVLQHLGMSVGEITMLLALHLLFMVAVWRLTDGLPTPVRWASNVFALVLPHFYASDQRFGYSEAFLTARTLAEPFAVLALAAAVRQRQRAACAWMAVATLAHPLVALPGWLVGWRLLCERDRRANWLALLVLPVLALAAAGVRPFDALFHRYDPVWFNMVERANSFVFLTTWHLPDWQHVAFDVVLLWLAGRDRTNPLAGLCRAALVVVVGFDLLSLAAVDGLHNVLLTQLQLWRAGWISHLVAMLMLAPTAAGLWRLNAKGRLAAAALLLAAVMVSSTARTGWEVSVVAYLAVWLAYSKFEISHRLVALGIVACVLGAAVISGVEYFFYLDQIQLGLVSGILVGRASGVPMMLPALMLAVAGIGLWPLLRPGRASIAVAAVVGVAGLVLGVAQWDQRSDWTREVERHQGGTHPFQAFIPPRAKVYWPDDLMATWAMLGRSAFFTDAQGAGTLFSRETAVETFKRLQATSPYVVQSRVCRQLASTGLITASVEDCKPTDVAMIDVCHLTGDGPDFIVLSSPLKAPAVSRWRFQPTGDSAPIDYFLYDCKKLH